MGCFYDMEWSSCLHPTFRSLISILFWMKVHSKKEDSSAKKEEGEDEYLLVPPARAKDTGLTGKYWSDVGAELPSSARSRRSTSKSKPSTPATSTKGRTIRI